MPLLFSERDFTDITEYPALHTKQFKRFLKILKELKSKRPIMELAEEIGCHHTTVWRALKKTLKPKQKILTEELVKILAMKRKDHTILTDLCPEYKDWPVETILKILKFKNN